MLSTVVDVRACIAVIPLAMASSVVEETESATKNVVFLEEESILAALQEASGALIGFMIVVVVAHLSGWRPIWGKPKSAKELKKTRKTKESVSTATVSASRKVVQQAAEPKVDSSIEARATQAHPNLSNSAAVRLQQETNALASQVSTGRAEQVPRLLDGSLRRLYQHYSEPSVRKEFAEQLLLSAVRSCASKRFFSEALQAYRHMSGQVSEPPCSLWSLLLWACVESNEFNDGALFILKLRSAQEAGRGEISQLDFINIVRYCHYRKDMELFQEVLKDWGEGGLKMEVRTRNRALALFTANPSSHALDFAAELIKNTSHVPLDAVAYNTLMRGYAGANKWHVCLQLYDQMRADGITPSDITFGVLLDACIKAGKLKHVKALFEDLRVSGVPRNVVHYTTLIKGLVAGGDLAYAREILNEMGQTQDSRPDVITYSTLAKAYADAGFVEDGISLLQMMQEQGVTPDAVLFNIILGGCCNKKFEANEILNIFNRICAFGFVPTSSTLSVLIKACAKSEAVMLAMEVIEGAPHRFGWTPELRIYMQLAQACCSSGMGDCILEVYELMVKALGMTASSMDDATRTRFGRFCEQCQLPPERYVHIRKIEPAAVQIQ